MMSITDTESQGRAGTLGQAGTLGVVTPGEGITETPGTPVVESPGVVEESLGVVGMSTVMRDKMIITVVVVEEETMIEDMMIERSSMIDKITTTRGSMIGTMTTTTGVGNTLPPSVVPTVGRGNPGTEATPHPPGIKNTHRSNKGASPFNTPWQLSPGNCLWATVSGQRAPPLAPRQLSSRYYYSIGLVNRLLSWQQPRSSIWGIALVTV